MTWTPLELAANLITALCIFLAGRNSVHTWWTGIVGTILFGALFYQSQLYADATLQVFFVFTGIIGWYSWLKSGPDSTPAPITLAAKSTMAGMLIISLIVTALYGWLLHSYTDAYAPWIDSAVLTLSVSAQLLLMRRKLQTWILWAAVNTLSVPLYASRGLYLTAFMYGLFWINAIYSWIHWQKLMDADLKRSRTFGV